jgi:hypothetical protein
MSARELTSAAAVEKQRRGVEETIFGRNMEEGCAPQGEQAAPGRAAI